MNNQPNAKFDILRHYFVIYCGIIFIDGVSLYSSKRWNRAALFMGSQAPSFGSAAQPLRSLTRKVFIQSDLARIMSGIYFLELLILM